MAAYCGSAMELPWNKDQRESHRLKEVNRIDERKVKRRVHNIWKYDSMGDKIDKILDMLGYVEICEDMLKYMMTP